MSLLLICLLNAAHAAHGYLGLDYVPLSRADLSAAASGETSGTGLSEFDGVLRPPLTAWGGWTQGRSAWLLGLSVGWERTASYVGEQRTLSSRGGLRPSLDQRLYLSAPFREAGGAQPWLQWGVYGVVPWAREVSDAWTEEEAEAMATLASADRGRIGGYGLRLGGGVEVPLTAGLYLGGRALAVVHQGQVRSEDGVVVSTQIRPEAALTVGWRL